MAQKIDKAVFPGWQGGPLEHVIAGKAVAFREAAHPSFKEYAHQIVTNASALAAALAEEGFRLVSGGTDNHMMVVDLRPFDEELTGKVAQNTLDEAGITLNKNTIPDDPRSPFVTSGLRIGTPSVTTQGMEEAQMAADRRRTSPAPCATARTRLAGGDQVRGRRPLRPVPRLPERRLTSRRGPHLGATVANTDPRADRDWTVSRPDHGAGRAGPRRTAAESAVAGSGSSALLG